MIEDQDPFKAAVQGPPPKPVATADPFAAAVVQPHDIHQEYRSGNLARRMASENLQDEAETPNYASRALGGIASFAKHVPGAEALQAIVAAKANRIPYADALKQIQEAEASSGAVGKINAAVGGTIGALATPGGPVMQGVKYGAASGLMGSDPNQGLVDRLKSGAIQAAVGGTVGKVANVAGTALQAKLPTWLGGPETAAANVLRRKGARTEVSEQLYDQFRALGELPQTPALAKLVGDGTAAKPGLPIVRRAIEAVKGESPSLSELPDLDARVLDAAYKRVGNKAFTAAHGFEPAEAQRSFLDALDEAAQAKGGSYGLPVAAYRGASKEINAVQQGKLALRTAAKTTGPSMREDVTSSPEGFEQYLKQNPGAPPLAQEGVMGALKQRSLAKVVKPFGIPIPYAPSRARLAAPNLLRLLQARGATEPQIAATLKALGISEAAGP